MPSGNTAEPRLNWGDIRTLEYLYPNACRDNSIFDLPLKAQPVIFSKVAYGERNVPYVAEVKSIGAGVTYYSEMDLYGMAAMIESFSQQMKNGQNSGSMSPHQSHLLSLGQLTWSI